MSEKDKIIKPINQQSDSIDVPEVVVNKSIKVAKMVKDEMSVIIDETHTEELSNKLQVSQPAPKVQKSRKILKDVNVNVNVTKLTDYRCYCLPNLKNVYLKLLNDNITYLLEYIYTNKTREPYNLAEVRVALAMQMILSSDKLIPIPLSSLIAKDLEGLRKDDEYTGKWANPMMKRKRLLKELELLKKHTEIDDSISLNLPDQKEIENKVNIEDFDIHSGLSTLNVSAVCPIDEDSRGACSIM